MGRWTLNPCLFLALYLLVMPTMYCPRVYRYTPRKYTFAHIRVRTHEYIFTSSKPDSNYSPNLK